MTSAPTPDMAEPERPVVIANPWDALRRFTPARIALGRSGISQPTAAQLAFQLAHAQARDAVHHAFDVDATAAAIEALGLATVRLHSAAPDRATYLQRPDLGRRLDPGAADALGKRDALGKHDARDASDASDASDANADAAANTRAAPAPPRVDLAIVVADGLSALAVERHAAPFLGLLLPMLEVDRAAWSTAPVALVGEARVAIGDEIGERLHADLVLVLIGERPGLSSPDSMGLYLTWAPRPGRSDAERNCISNVRPEGLPYAAAAARAALLMQAARRRGLTGVSLKDESDLLPLEPRLEAPASP